MKDFEEYEKNHSLKWGDDFRGIEYFLAIHAHEGQLYGEYDYFSGHILNVVENLNFIKDYPESLQKIVAYLHDIVEDTWVDIEYLNKIKCPALAVTAIDVLTKKKGQSLSQYLSLVKRNPLALVVKKSDTLCNLRQSYLDGNKKRVIKYSKQLAELYEDSL